MQTNPSGSAELYDPQSGTWAATGSMTQPRGAHGAAMLPDGRVLVAGGWAGGPMGDVVRGAEIYDPATGQWTRTGDLITARTDLTLVAVRDGTVLAVMGTDSGDFMTSVSAAERYDPASGTWSPAGDTGFAGSWHTATLLPDGRVLVVGGYDGGPRRRRQVDGPVRPRVRHLATVWRPGRSQLPARRLRCFPAVT